DIFASVVFTHCCAAGDNFLSGDFAEESCESAFAVFFDEPWLSERIFFAINSVSGIASRHSAARCLLNDIPRCDALLCLVDNTRNMRVQRSWPQGVPEYHWLRKQNAEVWRLACGAAIAQLFYFFCSLFSLFLL